MQIEWKKRAKREVESAIMYGVDNFGERIAIQFYQRLKMWVERLEQHPEIGSAEPLLTNRKHLYRSLIIHKHHKLIYYIDNSLQTIYIVDL